MELRRDGVRTMLVCPGYVRTNFHRNALAGQPPAGIVKGKAFAIDAAQCAAAIRRGLERDARTIVTPRACWALAAAARLFPGLVEERLARINGTA
jgi:short-subunit dehydrogenase